MNGILDFLSDLQNKNINISVASENLIIEGEKEQLTDEIKTEIKKNKTEIIRFLKAIRTKTHMEITVAAKKEYYIVSLAQRRMYILNQIAEQSTNYNMTGAVEIEGNLDKERLNKVFKQLIDRHEAFRTSFEMAGGEIVQKIKDKVEFDIEYDIAKEEEIAGIEKEFVRPFDLTKAPLLRVKVINIESNRYIMLYDMHHIISDWTSMGIIINEFVQFYNGEIPPKLTIQYKDFAEWQKAFITEQKIKEEEKYWVNQFAGNLPELNLPLNFSRKPGITTEVESISFDIEDTLTQKLNQLSIGYQGTVFITMLSVYFVLLGILCGQEDIIIGVPERGRTKEETENIIGMFVNTMVFRQQPQKEKRFIDFLYEVKENILQGYENQNYSFENLIEHLNIKRKPNRTPLFDVLFNYLKTNKANNELNKNPDDLIIKPYRNIAVDAKFDLSLYIFDKGQNLSINYVYRTSLFKKESIKYILDEYIKLLKEIVKEPDRKIKEYNIFEDIENE